MNNRRQTLQVTEIHDTQFLQNSRPKTGSSGDQSLFSKNTNTQQNQELIVESRVQVQQQSMQKLSQTPRQILFNNFTNHQGQKTDLKRILFKKDQKQFINCEQIKDQRSSPIKSSKIVSTIQHRNLSKKQTDKQYEKQLIKVYDLKKGKKPKRNRRKGHKHGIQDIQQLDETNEPQQNCNQDQTFNNDPNQSGSNLKAPIDMRKEQNLYYVQDFQPVQVEKDSQAPTRHENQQNALPIVLNNNFFPQQQPLPQPSLLQTLKKHKTKIIYLTSFIITSILFTIIGAINCWFPNQICYVVPTRSPPLTTMINQLARFPNNSCTRYNYTVYNQMQNKKFYEDYVAVFCVTNVTEDHIDFVTSIQPSSKNSSDSAPVQFDIAYEKLFFTNKSNDQYQSVQSTQYQNVSNNVANSSSENSTTQFDSALNPNIDSKFKSIPSQNKSFSDSIIFTHPIYRFSINMTGQILWMLFPKKGDKHVRSLLKSFLEAFTPLVDQKLYKAKNISQVQKHNRLLQTMNQTNGGLNDGSSIYNDYTDKDKNMVLQNNQINLTSDKGQNTESHAEKNFTFSQNGTMLKSNAEAKVQFISDSKQKSQDFQVIDTEQMNFKVNQKIQIRFVYMKQSKQENLKQIIALSQDNQTLNYTLSQFNQYLTRPADHFQGYTTYDNTSAKNTTRLLLENSDGSIMLAKVVDKQYNIIKLRPLGVELSYQVYATIGVRMRQDPNDQYKKIPYFNMETGSILNIGYIFTQKQPFMKQQKQLPPLSLKYTLNQIEDVLKALKSNFIKQITGVFGNLLQGNFDEIFNLKSLDLSKFVDEILGKILKQYGLLDPYNVVKKVIDMVEQAKTVIQNTGIKSINDIKKPLLLNLIEEINKYSNEHLPAVMDAFRQFKQGIQNYKSNGLMYFDSKLTQFSDQKSKVFNKTSNLISAEYQKQFNQQMKKAIPVVQFLRYIESGEKDYLKILLQNFDIHERNILNQSNEILSSYLIATQKNLTSLYQDLLKNANNTFLAQWRAIEAPSIKFMTDMDNLILTNLQNIAQTNQLTQNNWKQSITNHYNRLAADAGNVGNHASGSCCKRNWLKKCTRNNPMVGPMRAQRDMFNGWRGATQGVVNNALTIVLQFLKQTSQIFNDKSISTKQKNSRFKKISQIFVKPDLSQTISEIIARRDSANSIAGQICGDQSQSTRQYGRDLQVLRGYVVSINQGINILGNKINNYNSLYSVEDYQKIQDVLVFSQQAILMKQNITNYYNNGIQAYKTLINHRKTYSIKQFLSEKNKIIQKFIGYLSQLKDRKQDYCGNQQQFQRVIKKQNNEIYPQKIKNINQLIQQLKSKPYINSLIQLKNSYQSMIGQIFLGTSKTQFCDQSNQIRKFVDYTAVPLINELNGLQQQFNIFQKTWNNYIAEMRTIEKNSRQLVDGFYILRNLFQYQKYINIARSFAINTKNVFFLCVDKMAEIRQATSTRIKQLNYTQYTNQDSVKQIVKIFDSTIFTIHYELIFELSEQKFTVSRQIIQALSYDIIELVVAGKQIKKYVQKSFVDFQSGIPQYKDIFISTFDTIKNFPDSFSISYLASINQRLNALGNKMSVTVFPLLQGKIQNISQDFRQNINIKSQQYLATYHNNLRYFEDYINMINIYKRSYLNKIDNITSILYRKLNQLKITDLNKIIDLGNLLKNRFNTFFNDFQKQFAKIGTLSSIIKGDFQKLFTIDTFILQMFGNIKNSYLSTLGNMTLQINNTLKGMNEDFRVSLQISPLYQKLCNLNINLAINFDQIQTKVNEVVKKLKNQLDSLSANFKQQLLELNRLKIQFENMKKGVEQRVSMIKNNFKNAKKGFTNVKNLLFSVLKNDIEQYILKDVNQAFSNMDKLFQQDLKSISNFTKQKLSSSVSYLSDTVDKIAESYQIFKNQRNNVKGQISDMIKKVTNMTKNPIFNKFSNLKQGQLYLKGKVEDFLSNGNVVLFHKDLFNRTTPVLNITIPIPVVIGVFYIDFGLNFTLGISFTVGLQNFRDIDANATFGAGIVVYVSFSWGLRYIIEVGVYMRGPILRAQIKPRLLVQGLVPIQLIKHITDVSQITNKNQLRVYSQLYFGLYAFQVQIGFFFTFYTLKILWVNIRFCINLFFGRFCINFRVPLTYIFLPKRWQFPKPLEGTGKQFRLARVKLLSIGN